MEISSAWLAAILGQAAWVGVVGCHGTPKDARPISPSLIVIGLIVLTSGAFTRGWEFFSYLIGVLSGTEPMRQGDGWMGLTFVALIFGALGGYFIWEIKESTNSGTDETPIPLEEEQEEEETISEEEWLEEERKIEEERERALKQEREKAWWRQEEDWMLEDHYDPDNEHDTSMDYGIGEDTFDEEE